MEDIDDLQRGRAGDKCAASGLELKLEINYEHESPYHLLPLKQSVRHELAGPDCYSVVLKTKRNYALATRKLLYL